MAESLTTKFGAPESEPLNDARQKPQKAKPKAKSGRSKSMLSSAPAAPAGPQSSTGTPGSFEKLEEPPEPEDQATKVHVDSDVASVAPHRDQPDSPGDPFEADRFHNSFFEPKIQEIIKSLLINLTSPVYFMYRWLDFACDARDKSPQLEERANFLKANRAKEWCYMCPFQTAINSGFLAWILAGDASEVSLSEVFLPLWFQAGMSLSTAATRNLDPHQWDTMKQDIGMHFKSRIQHLEPPCSDKLVAFLDKIFQEVDNQSYNWRLERWQYYFLLLLGLCFRRISPPDFWAGVNQAHQILLLIDLHRKFVNCAHESLTQRMARLKQRSWTVISPSEKRESVDERKKKLAPEMVNFMGDYQQDYFHGKVNLDKVAEQLLVGWPEEVDAGYFLQWIVSAAQVIWGLLAVFLAVVAALVPDFLRDKHINFKLPEDDWCKVVSIVFLTMMYLHFYVCFVYPGGIMLLFTEMSKAYRIFSIMLTNERAARSLYVPYVRVDEPEDILAWYELYSYFILSTKRRKFSLEFSFAFNLFTLIAMMALVAWYVVFPDEHAWQPGVLFCETVVVLVSFLFFSMPPLFMGLRVNMLRRRTIDLLLGHASEARAFYQYRVSAKETSAKETSAKETSAKHSGTQERNVEEGNAKTGGLDSAARAIDMAETIANRLRLDSWLVVRTMGVELTVAQFTAIASLLSTALVYAARNADKYVSDWWDLLEKLFFDGA